PAYTDHLVSLFLNSIGMRLKGAGEIHFNSLMNLAIEVVPLMQFRKQGLLHDPLTSFCHSGNRKFLAVAFYLPVAALATKVLFAKELDAFLSFTDSVARNRFSLVFSGEGKLNEKMPERGDSLIGHISHPINTLVQSLADVVYCRSMKQDLKTNRPLGKDFFESKSFGESLSEAIEIRHDSITRIKNIRRFILAPVVELLGLKGAFWEYDFEKVVPNELKGQEKKYTYLRQSIQAANTAFVLYRESARLLKAFEESPGDRSAVLMKYSFSLLSDMVQNELSTYLSGYAINKLTNTVHNYTNWGVENSLICAPVIDHISYAIFDGIGSYVRKQYLDK
ncbi:MAG: hypothetical protein GWP59_07250, partial [Chlamydiales bacterium]|nr:hypothetical protein [Chlamydiales bacterium]